MSKCNKGKLQEKKRELKGESIIDYSAQFMMMVSMILSWGLPIAILVLIVILFF